MPTRGIYTLDAYIQKLKNIKQTFKKHNPEMDFVVSVGKVGGYKATFVPEGRNDFNEDVKKLCPDVFFPSKEFDKPQTISDLEKCDFRLLGTLVFPEKFLADEAEVHSVDEFIKED